MLFDSQSSNQLISFGADALNPSPLQGTAALSLSTGSSGLVDPLQQSSLRLGSSASADSAIATGISVVGGTPLTAINFAPALAPPLQALEAAGTFEIHQNNNTGALSNQILGNTAGLSNFDIDYIGDARAIGTFEHDPFGLGSGIVLSTGKVEDLAGKNISDGGFSPGKAISLTFTPLTSNDPSAPITQIFRADLSNIGIDLNSFTIADSGSASGGLGGKFSGFDLDAVKLSHQKIDSALGINAIPSLDVLDFSPVGTIFTPGSQRPSTSPTVDPVQVNLNGTLNGNVNSGFATPGLFDAPSTGAIDRPGRFSLGDAGRVGFNLKSTIPAGNPLFLYVGEVGNNDGAPAGNISVSNRPISGLNDLSTDFGAPGAKDDDISLKLSFDADATVQNLYFQFAFGSEELVEYAGSNFNDAFSLSLNGFNMARLSDGAAVTINNLATNPFGAYHPDLIYNPVGKGPASDQTRLDGYTKVLTFAAPLEANAHNTLEIRVKDGRDGLLDSAVFIRTGTFGTIDPTLITGPVFRDDLFSTNEDTAITIAPASLLANDTGANGATLSVTGVNGTGTKGTITFDGTGITYDPAQKFESLAQGETASDRFAYLVTDSNGGTGSANVTVTITGLNDNPDAVNDTFATVDNIPLIITPSTLLRNDSDVDTSDVLTITAVSAATHGTVNLDSVGNILFTPDSSFISQASFSYTISDGKGGTDTALVTLSRCSCNDGSTDTWNYIIGTPDSDVLVGTDGRDYITALAGDDVLIGGKGADYQDGGDGVDSLSYVDSTAAVTINLATGTASGGDATGDAFINIERAIGSKYDDFLIGNSQDNLLDGGLGNDTMSGGLGDDIYDVNSPEDIVIENANQGTDYVSSSINYTLGDNLEYLYITGGATIGTGNSLNNVIYGNDLDNTLSGLDGNDYLYGIGGNDILDGGAGNDALDGGIGNDTMSGGLGNDSYDVDSPGDIVVELADQGIDGVSSSIDYTLGDNLENLFLRGNANSGTGNSLNNQIYGNDFDSALFGLDGNDYLIGDGIGNHTMYGGLGDDTYYVDGGDIVVELASQGVDGINSSINYTLGDNVENLYLTGSATNGTGNSLNNQIYGNNLDNVLSGLDGDDDLIGLGGSDILDGGLGDDVLVGGAGADKFRFHALSDGIDRIQDFQAIEGDQIEIVKSTFGASSISQFSYDATTGALYFDANSTDTIAPTQFAVLVNTPSDFSIALNIALI